MTTRVTNGSARAGVNAAGWCVTIETDRARPTLRCLRDDLCLPVPTLDRPLDEVDHPLLGKANEQFAGAGARERVRAVDDQVLFKVKVRRWRGAVWVDAPLPWLVAAGWREAGSADDFYARLARDCRTARARYNATHQRALTSDTYAAHLLPGEDDRRRYRLEAATRLVRRLETVVPDLVRASLCDGREHVAALDSFVVGIQVRAEHGDETYVAVRITGPVPDTLATVVLDIVPGCDRTGWYPEATLPDRSLLPNEQAWSNLMDTAVAGKLLEVD